MTHIEKYYRLTRIVGGERETIGRDFVSKSEIKKFIKEKTTEDEMYDVRYERTVHYVKRWDR